MKLFYSYIISYFSLTILRQTGAIIATNHSGDETGEWTSSSRHLDDWENDGVENDVNQLLDYKNSVDYDDNGNHGDDQHSQLSELIWTKSGENSDSSVSDENELAENLQEASNDQEEEEEAGGSDGENDNLQSERRSSSLSRGEDEEQERGRETAKSFLQFAVDDMTKLRKSITYIIR